uniref:Uncharacterized protein n=1 Tax=Romanomermis culicivorax TaxID=13658 RepID=A0A915K7R0_ROMCU
MISKSILITLQCVSCLLLIIGVILISSGMFTSSWLVADFEVDHHIHYHGLWRDCQLLGGTFGGRIRATGEWLCFSKIDKQNIDPEHQFKCDVRGLDWAFKPNSEVQLPIVGDKNRRIFSLLNWAFCKLPIHSLELPTVADCRRQ